MAELRTSKVAKIRLIATAAAVVLLVGTIGVVGFLSPDFSETVFELASTFFDDPRVAVERDLVYGSDPTDRMTGDLYVSPSTSTPRPAVVIVHGGSWAKGSKREFTEISTAREFAKNGYAAFSIDYRLLPAHTFPSDVVDIDEAVNFLAANAQKFHINPQRIFLWGTSSGATGALLAAYGADTSEFPRSFKHSKIAGVASISGPTDLNQESDNPYVQDYLHSHGKPADEAYAKQASPKFYADSAVPTIFVHGTDDRNVPITHAIELVNLLQQRRIPHSLVRVEGQTHFIGASSRRQCLRMVLQFFAALPSTDSQV
jgi:acetyl esterase